MVPFSSTASAYLPPRTQAFGFLIQSWPLTTPPRRYTSLPEFVMATFQLYLLPDRMYSVFAFSTPVMVSERPDSLQLQPGPDSFSGRPSAPILIVTTEFVVSSFVPAAVVSAAAADVPASANADTGRMESTILSASIMLTMRFFMISSPLLIDLPGCPPKQNNRNGQKAKLSITLKFMEIKHFRPPHLPKFGTKIWAKSPYGGGYAFLP